MSISPTQGVKGCVCPRDFVRTLANCAKLVYARIARVCVDGGVFFFFLILVIYSSFFLRLLFLSLFSSSPLFVLAQSLQISLLSGKILCVCCIAENTKGWKPKTISNEMPLFPIIIRMRKETGPNIRKKYRFIVCLICRESNIWYIARSDHKK